MSEAFSQGVDFIEDMLRLQLVAAIGKTVTSQDFANYLNFHYRKIFRNIYRPQAFSYAIRRPDHYPEVFYLIAIIIIIFVDLSLIYLSCFCSKINLYCRVFYLLSHTQRMEECPHQCKPLCHTASPKDP